ncbi:MAG TPA: hypothetical protein VGM05_22625 [Planctomycetaceae bacterium]|jgi:hypothetical protein
MALACLTVVILARGMPMFCARPDWKEALISIPLRDDAWIISKIDDVPFVGLEEMPTRVFAVDSFADGFGATDSVIVSVPYSEAGDDHLRLIASGPRVISLTLDGTRITDAGLSHLRGMAHLRTLSLAATEISDAGAQMLKDVPSLRHLDLRRTRLTNSSLAPLVALRQLELLNLSGTLVDGAGLTCLSKLPNLKALILDDLPLNDGDVAALGTITSLRDVQLHGTQITAAGLAHMASLLSLDACYVDSGRLSRHDLDALRREYECECRGAGIKN